MDKSQFILSLQDVRFHQLVYRPSDPNGISRSWILRLLDFQANDSSRKEFLLWWNETKL